GPGADSMHIERQRIQPRLPRLKLQAALLVELLPQPAAGSIARIRERKELARRRRARLLRVELPASRLALTPAPLGLSERPLAELRLQPIQLLKLLDRNEDLTPHLDERRMPLPCEPGRHA